MYDFKAEMADAIGDHLPIGIAFVDPKRRHRYANAAYQELFGLHLDHIVGRTLRDVVGRRCYAAVRGHVAQALGGEASEITIAHRSRDGRTRRINCRFAPGQAADGAAAGFYVLATDATPPSAEEECRDQTNRQIELIADSVPVMVSYCDAQHRYRFVNRMHREYFGTKREDVIGRHWADVVGEQNAATIWPRMTRALRGERVEFEDVLLSPNGERRYMRGVYTPHIENGRILGVFVLREDITTLHETLTALEERNHQIQILADNLPAVVTYIDKGWRYRFTNRWQREWIHTCTGDVIGRSVEEVLSPAFYARVAPMLRRALPGERVEFEDSMVVPKLGLRHFKVVYVPHVEHDEVVGMFILRSDVSELKHAELAMQHLAMHDPLTDLPNRRLLIDRLAQSLRLTRRVGSKTCVLMIDLNGFKQINDTHGHAAGDSLLRTVAMRLASVCRASDTLARLGGDEFVVVTGTGTNQLGAVALATKIEAALSQTIEIGNQICRIGSARISCRNSKPFIRGMLRSSRMT